MNLYEIKEKILLSGKLVYSTKELSKLISRKPEITNVYIHRLIKKGFTKKINGKVIFTYDDYVLGTQLVEPSYISLTSALFFHNIINQVPAITTCVTTIKNKQFKDIQTKYHKITPKLFFGYKKHLLDNSYAYIASPEKAILDGIYLKIFTKIIIKNNLERLNLKLLKKYSKLYPLRVRKELENV